MTLEKTTESASENGITKIKKVFGDELRREGMDWPEDANPLAMTYFGYFGLKIDTGIIRVIAHSYATGYRRAKTETPHY